MRTRPALAILSAALPGHALAQDAARIDGERIFRIHCAACHGATGTEGAAGDIRGLGAGTLRNALRGVEQMPSFDFLSEEELSALAEWLGVDLPSD